MRFNLRLFVVLLIGLTLLLLAAYRMGWLDQLMSAPEAPTHAQGSQGPQAAKVPQAVKGPQAAKGPAGPGGSGPGGRPAMATPV